MAEKPKKPTPEEFAEYQRGAAAVVMAPPGSFPFEKQEANVDVFDAPLRAAIGNAHVHGKANHASHPQERKDAQAELSKQRAMTRATAPPRSGQRPTWAQWREYTENRLRSMSPEARDQVIWSDWYNALSERGAAIVDELLLEFGEQETRAEEAAAYRRADLLGESEATAALNAELDQDDAWGDEFLPGSDEYEIEREMAEAEYGGEAS
jgi:hypothetical protein